MRLPSARTLRNLVAILRAEGVTRVRIGKDTVELDLGPKPAPPIQAPRERPGAAAERARIVAELGMTEDQIAELTAHLPQ